ncbi:caspase family protein [Sulfobacillus thermotolerans]|uniref:caspase family protein n=1 Tax=Sulfobacillus thermotolerans TaxID=338644 RepID=UPI003368AA18
MRKALIVGINDYPGVPLDGCVNDAVQMANTLERDGDGTLNFSVKRLTSPADTITKASLRHAIQQLFTGNSDVALLYFSGHGLINSAGGWIVTPDFQRYDEGISMDEILNTANQSMAKDKVIILDCCFSGTFGSPALQGGTLAQLSDGLTVLTASNRGTGKTALLLDLLGKNRHDDTIVCFIEDIK